jgi:hypothetical protein
MSSGSVPEPHWSTPETTGGEPITLGFPPGRTLDCSDPDAVLIHRLDGTIVDALGGSCGKYVEQVAEADVWKDTVP